MTTTDLYSTHLPFLEKIFSLIEKPNLVIEFGMGNYSTEFFIQNSNKVESIEMQSKEWYDNMHEKFKTYDNWSPFMFIGPDEYKKHNFLKPDLCFVDGHGNTRPECGAPLPTAAPPSRHRWRRAISTAAPPASPGRST